MAIVPVRPFPIYSLAPEFADAGTVTTDATGESCSVVGRLWIDGAPAGTKVLSAGGGGKI